MTHQSRPVRMRSLFGRLMISYILIIVVALAGLGLIMAGLLRSSLLDARADELASQGTQLAAATAQYLAGTMDSQTYESMLNLFDLSTGARIFVVNKNRQVVAVSGTSSMMGGFSFGRGLPGPGWMMGRGSSGMMGPGWGGGMGMIVNILGSQLSNTEVAQVLSGQTVSLTGYSSIFGQHVVTVGLPAQLSNQAPGTPVLGGVFLNASVATVGPVLQRVEVALAIAGVGALLLALLAGFTLSRSISGPLRQMSRVARDMAHGQFEERVAVSGAAPQEVGELAHSLNYLAAEAGKVEEMRREFVANVSHELKTPLTAVRGFVEPLIDGTVDDPETSSRYLGIIRDETVRLSRLIDDLLDLSRLEAGKEKLALEPVDLAELGSGALERLGPLFTDKNVEARVEVAPGVPPALADGERLMQVLTNLLTNAIRHTPAGGHVTVKVSHVASDVQVSVTDDGEGIAPAELPLIWDRFYKVDHSHQRTTAGTGLGLPISKRIIEAHGGRVWAESNGEGKGATFHFTIPASTR